MFLLQPETDYLKTNYTMKRVITTVMPTCCTLMVAAQNIDFDLPGKTTPGKDTEINYIS